MAATIYIPARMASKRFPGKPLVEIGGVPLIKRTYEVAKAAEVGPVIVATAGEADLESFLRGERIPYVATDPGLQSGTARCSAAAGIRETNPGRIINLQADEPCITPETLQQLANEPTFLGQVMTAVTRDPDPKSVRVAYVPWTRRCHWFSREIKSGFGHVGVYAFATKQDMRLACSKLSCGYVKNEDLEQLAWIEAGFVVWAIESPACPSVNEPADIPRVTRYLGI